jgi:hypothetical protein
MPAPRKKRRTHDADAEAPGTERRPASKTKGIGERFDWSVLLPSSASASSSSSLHMPLTSLRRALVWEDTHEDHPEEEEITEVVHADEAHDFAAADIVNETEDLEETSQKEGLLKDLHWPADVVSEVYQSSTSLVHRCVSGLSKSNADVDVDLSCVVDEAAQATADMREEAENLAVMQHVLGQSFMDHSNAAASEAKALALGLLPGLEETEIDPEADRRQRLLLARHASDLPDVQNTPCCPILLPSVPLTHTHTHTHTQTH